MRLLCVEDETSLREDIAEYLRMHAYEVDEAADGEQAIAQINTNHYDLVLCDIKMPQMDGYDLLRAVRNANHLVTTPFIFLSALNENNDKLRAHEGGCDGYLTKPIDFSLLDATLRGYIERQRARDYVYTTALESTRYHVMTAIEDTVNGPMRDAAQIVDHLREKAPTLDSATLDQQLAEFQLKVNQQLVSMRTLYMGLQLQMKKLSPVVQPTTVNQMIEDAITSCRYSYPQSRVCYTPIPSAYGVLMVDPELMRQALAGLMAAVPHAYDSDEVFHFEVTPDHAILTVSDHLGMLEGDDFISIEETMNLALLSDVTRARLVALIYSVQVMKAHGGSLEIKIWPEGRLAVRLLFPRTAMSSTVLH